MSHMKKSLLAVALVAVLTFGLSGAAKAGSFGTPDPTLGSTVLGWFDLSIGGMDDVLPVVVNASNVNYPAGVGKGVHIIIWNVRSQHVWDKNLPFTPWHVRGFSIRDIILSMPPAQRNQVLVTLDDGSQRFRGYFTMATVFEFPGTLLPGIDATYPFTYENHLGGWMYLTNLLEGQADGLPLTAVEASTLYSSGLLTFQNTGTAFMMSFFADFWNRDWWWTDLLPYLDDQAPSARMTTTTGFKYSRLYNCNVLDFFFRDDDGLDQDFLPDTPFKDSNVFERFDAAAGINSQLITRGLVITSDDAFLGVFPRVSTPYNNGGMLLIGRFFKDFAATIANEFANKLVIWTDRNGGAATRQTQAVIWDENEVAISLPIFFPDELTVLRIDELVGTIPAGIVVFDTRQIQFSNGYNPILGFWLQWYYGLFPGFPFVCPSNLLDGFLVDLTHSSMLQLLGWTTTEALATADLTWGAAFPMLRDYKVGSPVRTFVIDFDGRTQPIVPTE